MLESNALGPSNALEKHNLVEDSHNDLALPLSIDALFVKDPPSRNLASATFELSAVDCRLCRRRNGDNHSQGGKPVDLGTGNLHSGNHP